MITTYSYIILLLSSSGDIRGFPIYEYPTAQACESVQRAREAEHKKDIIFISACMPRASGPKAGTNIIIQMVAPPPAESNISR